MQDSLLLELYQTPRDPQTLDLVARNAPILYFDAREPFLPLAAGYTLFTGDGPSPSFDRIVELRPEDRPAAALAIEYAIWWDWDIHHLYELEHAWVYLDSKGFPVRLEASWHGKYYDLPLKLGGRKGCASLGSWQTCLRARSLLVPRTRTRVPARRNPGRRCTRPGPG